MDMSDSPARAHALLREFFKIYPDYSLCRTLALNVADGVVTHTHSIELLQNKAGQVAALRDSIRQVLDKKKVFVDETWRLLKDLTLDQICRLDDRWFAEAMRFYFKYPHAHGRLEKRRLFRSRAARLKFLRLLLEEGRRRSLPIDYATWEDMLSLL